MSHHPQQTRYRGPSHDQARHQIIVQSRFSMLYFFPQSQPDESAKKGFVPTLLRSSPSVAQVSGCDFKVFLSYRHDIAKFHNSSVGFQSSQEVDG